MRGGRDAQAARPSTEASSAGVDRVHRYCPAVQGHVPSAMWRTARQHQYANRRLTRRGAVERLALQRGVWRCAIQSLLGQGVRAWSSGCGVASRSLYRSVRDWRYHCSPTGVSRCWVAYGPANPVTSTRRAKKLPNNRMQLTKLRAAPVLQAEVPPCARAASMDAGTASQLIRSVRQTWG
jgi:hypothetical protein